MAVTALTSVAVVKNIGSIITESGATAINAANTCTAKFPKEDKLAILVNNTYAGAKKVTFSKGDFLAAGQGDLVASIAQNDTQLFILTSDRFKKADGTISMSFEAGMTGFVEAIALP